MTKDQLIRETLRIVIAAAVALAALFGINCGKGDIPRIRSGMVGFCGARDLCWSCRGSGKMTAETAEKHKLWAKERGGK